MQLHEQPDSEIVRQIQSGAAAAFDELMRRYKRPVVNFIFRMLGNAQDADDVAQDVFVRMYQNLDAYRAETKFSTWLFALARNAAIDRIRWRSRHRTESIESVPGDCGVLGHGRGGERARDGRSDCRGHRQTPRRPENRHRPVRISRNVLCRNCGGDALFREIGGIPPVPRQTDTENVAPASVGMTCHCRSLTTLNDSRQRISVLPFAPVILDASDSLATTGVAGYSHKRRKLGTRDVNSLTNRARWCANAKTVRRSSTHQHHRQRPSLSRRKLKTLAGNSEVFFRPNGCQTLLFLSACAGQADQAP